MLSLRSLGQLLLILLTTGCMSARPNQTLEQAQSRDRETGEKLGLGLGAGFGILAGKQLGDKLGWKGGKGQMLGAFVGGIAGISLGRKMGETAAERRATYAEERKKLDDQIAILDQRIEELRQSRRDYDIRVEKFRGDMKQAAAQKETDEEQLAVVEARRSAIAATISEVKAECKTLDEDIQAVRNEISHAEGLLKEYPDRTAFQEYRRKLTVRLDQMIEHLQALTAVESRLVVQREAMGMDE